jgi:carnitine 3-dehydrogenase
MGEAKAGEAIYVSTQLLAVDDKRLHVFLRLHRGRDDALIATAEQLHLHVDTARAKATAVDSGVRAKLDAIRQSQSGLARPSEAGRSVGQARGPGATLDA